MSPISIVLVGRFRTQFAAARRLLLESTSLELLAEAGDLDSAISFTERYQPDVLLLDAGLLNGTGRLVMQLILQKYPLTRVILLVQEMDENEILSCLSSGAKGYLEQHSFEIQLLKAIDCVAAGEAWVERHMVAKLLDRLTWLNQREPGMGSMGGPF
jgi:DNA-binding NarL/FixJ family response regulator